MARINRDSLRSGIAGALAALDYREREVLRLRFGLTDGYCYTLSEVGDIFFVTRERVRQIEIAALRKLQQPNRAQSLYEFLERPVAVPQEAPGEIRRPTSSVAACPRCTASRPSWEPTPTGRWRSWCEHFGYRVPPTSNASPLRFSSIARSHKLTRASPTKNFPSGVTIPCASRYLDPNSAALATLPKRFLPEDDTTRSISAHAPRRSINTRVSGLQFRDRTRIRASGA